MDSSRERVFALLSDLCEQQRQIPPDTVRLLSHTLLGTAREATPSALYAVRDAIPWLAAFVDLTDGVEPDTVAETMARRDALKVLDERVVSARLARAAREPADRSAPPRDYPARLTDAMRDLASLDAQLAEIDQRRSFQRLMDSSRLLATVLACSGGPNATARSRKLRGEVAAEMPYPPGDGRALDVLADLESTWDGGQLRAHPGFSSRTIRFELSAVDHLCANGFGPALRMALAVDPRGHARRDRLAAWPTSEFRDEPALAALADALASTRGAVQAHVRGQLPFRHLLGWIEYLRGPCLELAESRDISLREAISFAHFCLHVVNFCDLVADREDADDDDRRTLMDVEDELKSFALVGQETGLREASLDRVARNRWTSAPVLERVACRLGRIAAASVGGLPSGVVDSAAERGAREAVSQFPAAMIQMLDARLPFVRFEGIEALGQTRLDVAVAIAGAAVCAVPQDEADPCVNLDPSLGLLEATTELPGSQSGVEGVLRATTGLAMIAPAPGGAAQWRFTVRPSSEIMALLTLLAHSGTPAGEVRSAALRRLAVLSLPTMAGLEAQPSFG